MRVTVERKPFADALAGAARVAGDGRMIPAISHILLDATGDGLVLQATNGELSLSLRVEAQITEPGVAIVPKAIAQVVKAMGGADVRLEAGASGEPGQLKATSGAMDVKVATIGITEFPALPEAVTGPLVFDGEAMSMVKRVLPAASTDATRPVLTGVSLSARDGRESVAATDSYRLAVWDHANGTAARNDEAIIPAKAFAEALRLGGGASVAIAGNLATFALPGGGTLTTRLVEGQFPKWRELMPTPETWATCKREELLAVLGRVGIVAGSDQPVRVNFGRGASGDGLIYVSATGQIGSGSECIDADYSGDEMTFGFNAGYLIDALRAITGDEARIGLVAPLRPAIVEGADALRVLLMPMRLSD